MNLNQITIPSLDLELSIPFYQKLGLKLIVKALPHYARFECPNGEATFSLHQVKELPKGDGVYVYFESYQLDETVAELVKAGIQFDELPNDKSWLWREARLKDVDNNQLILFYGGVNRKNPPWRINELADNKLNLRKLLKEDCRVINKAFRKQGWNKPVEQYEHYLKLQEQGKRDIIIATYEGHFAGYVTIQWESDYPSFKEQGIPEIVDLNVLKHFQRNGIASSILDEAESRIQKVSPKAGIGFGLTEDYGAAQKLYFERQYKPDGKGIMQGNQPISTGDKVTVDHGLVLHLIKNLA